jgi:UDP-glucose 4-epimerase
MKIIVTGAAGFIGSQLCSKLLVMGHQVLGIDNLCRGRLDYLLSCRANEGFQFVEVDLADPNQLHLALQAAQSIGQIDQLWHLAANSDIPAGVTSVKVDLRDTFLSTISSLELCEQLGCRKFLFASSSAIYGDLGTDPMMEHAGPLLPISNYGAMKLASEAAISAACEKYLDHAYFFRFPNVVGVPATHGVLLDFVRKLKQTPGILSVLGDGTQCKPYLHVCDLIDAMLFISATANDRRNIFNIGPDDEGVSVQSIAEMVVAEASPGSKIKYGSDNKGWIGDVPKFQYDISKLRRLGWVRRLSSHAALTRALREIIIQEASVL